MSCASASVSAIVSPGATRNPVSPCTTASGIPAKRVDTTGRAAAIASIITVGKTLQIDPIVNAMNFRSEIRTALTKQLTTVIRFGHNELCGSADFPQKIVVAKILHEILSVRGDTERDS